MNDRAAEIEESRKLRTHADMYFKEKSPAYRAFQELASQAFRPGALETMVKELIAVAISICVKCEPCIDHHVREALRHGASEQQIVEAMEVAMEMGGGPATVQARVALACLELSRSGG
ncbi:MAG TPA: carboxymuconolactone decarboxylase family protein [Spirochaetia bacterium]|nr:carboxymuconolactone decarboxylase family protein [Spirochaetia bacterium]